MVAIARYYQRVQPDRFIQLFYQVRDLDNAPLLKPLAKWAAESLHARLHLYVSSQMVQCPSWVASLGRIDAEQILERCERDETGKPIGQFMICGPDAMQESIRCGLLAAGVPSSRIAVEGFATARRTQSAPTSELTPTGNAAPCNDGHSVLFAKSGKQGQTGQLAATVLEVAEEAGVPAESGCRNGDCGACLMKLLNGRVRYEQQPTFGPLADDEILACVALPDGPITLDS
jgi:ferredoxin